MTDFEKMVLSNQMAMMNCINYLICSQQWASGKIDRDMIRANSTMMNLYHETKDALRQGVKND